MFDAGTRLTTLLDEVARGTEVTITRHGVPIAKLTPVASNFDRAKARAAAEGLRRVSQGATLDGLRIRDLVNEGRS
jgi:prevent-host-death family protein